MPALPGAQDTPTASAVDPNLTKTGVAIGMVSDMSPEQARGEPLDARTDLFSFGAVLYEMARASKPFPATARRRFFTPSWAWRRPHPSV